MFLRRLICLSALCLTPQAFAAPAPSTSVIWTKGEAERIIQDLADVRRNAVEISESDRKRGLITVFDAHLPSVIKECEMAQSFGILKLAYVFATDKPGIDKDLKEFASRIIAPGANLQAATETCKAALRSLSIAILRVDRGSSWNAPNSSPSSPGDSP
jgi:hypothetical protein